MIEQNFTLSFCRLCKAYCKIDDSLEIIQYQDEPVALPVSIYVCTDCLETLEEDGYVSQK